MIIHWTQFQAALLSALVGFALVINGHLQKTRIPALLPFTLLGLNLSLWEVIDALTVSRSNPSTELIMVNIIVSLVIPLNALHFLSRVFADRSKLTRQLQFVMSVLLVLQVAIVLSGKRGIELADRWTHPVVFAEIAVVLFLIYRRYKKDRSSTEKTRFVFVLLPSTWAVLIAAVSFSPLTKNRAYGYLAILLIQYILFQTTVKRRVRDLFDLASRLIRALVMSLAVGAVFISLALWAGSNKNLLVFNILVGSLLVYILFRPVDRLVEELVAKFISKGSGGTAVRIMELSKRLKSTASEQEVVQDILTGLSSIPLLGHVAIYRQNETSGELELLGCIGEYPASLPLVKLEPVVRVAMHEGYLFKERVLEELEWFKSAGKEVNPRRVEFLSSALEVLNLVSSEIIVFIPGTRGWQGFIAVSYIGASREAYDLIQGLFQITRRLSMVFEASEIVKKQRERDRLAMLGELAAGLAHEIRNPLGAIRGAVDLIDPCAVDQEEFLEVIREEVDRLDGLVTRFLDFASPLAVEVVPVDVVSTAIRAWRLIGEPHGVTFRVPEGSVKVLAEEGLLTQVFMNLLKNSVEAGAKTISLNLLKNDEVEIRVRDDGEGMTKDVLARVFVPFETTKSHGTGLGMAVTKKLVMAFGGRIEVKSEKGRGTEVILWLKPVPD